MSRSSCLIELHYLPCIQYLRFFFEYEHVLLERHEHYQKGSYRNRCYIGSTTGPQMLSVPLLKGKHQQLPITEVKIAYHTPWYAQHWHAIQTAYGKSPFFIHYGDDLQEILYSRHEKLYDLNMTMLKWLLEKTHAPALLMETTDFSERSDDETIDYRNTITPTSALPTTAYNQVFMDRLGFVSNLSVLDLLMNLGPESYTYLNAMRVRE